MSTKINLNRTPADFEKFGRLLWEQLTTVTLSSGDRDAAVVKAVDLALTLTEPAPGDVALSESESTDKHLDRMLGHFNKATR